MARRDLSNDDLKIWRFVTRNVAPLRELPRHPSENTLADEPSPRAHKPAPVKVELPSAPRPSAPLKLGSVADIDRRTAQRFKRGDMKDDGRIDLHGLTLNQAHGALTAYLHSAAARGARCVTVVTGKGKGEGIGKIRAEVPHWLNQQPLRSLVLAVSQAQVQHGGAGALYVLLKRRR